MRVGDRVSFEAGDDMMARSVACRSNRDAAMDICWDFTPDFDLLAGQVKLSCCRGLCLSPETAPSSCSCQSSTPSPSPPRLVWDMTILPPAAAIVALGTTLEIVKTRFIRIL
ncbi:Aste57867_11205 [Aphanomyces stellatus]|uniref:Aste57867_11205 protein n=1 Tax=Aphanomyces stellatus TaxID=120398 RepID=A0A485KSW0_9STRA|nr:hypothetical protein As57867_011163 [Aphanomyces stellatus]VFT88072.1 Aste57867_11205 [Aphanomyces stellatus]